MKKKQLDEAKQEEQENIANEQIEKNGKQNTDGVAVADLLNLETEVQNIQQGVNQLRCIPSMPEDDIFSTDWAAPTTNGKGSSMLNGFMGIDSYKPKPVTTIEEGFDKLVDMNSLVMPTSKPYKATNPFLSDPSHEARKVQNPFDHIINPPKLSLNDLSAAKMPQLSLLD